MLMRGKCALTVSTIFSKLAHVVVNTACAGLPSVVLDAPGYVILQYLPLCCSKSAKPACPFEKVAGNQVERVLPYNTRMGKKKNCSGEDGEFGPEGVWADTEHHFATLKNISKKGPNLTKENWKVAMDYAQKVTLIQPRTLTPARTEESGRVTRPVFRHGVRGPNSCRVVSLDMSL